MNSKERRLAREAAGLCLRCPEPARPDRSSCQLCALKLSLRGKAQRQLSGTGRPAGRPLSPVGAAIRALLATGASTDEIVAQTGATRAHVRATRRRWRPT